MTRIIIASAAVAAIIAVEREARHQAYVADAVARAIVSMLPKPVYKPARLSIPPCRVDCRRA